MTDVFDDLISEAEEEEVGVDSRALEETILVGLLNPTLAPRILEKTRPGDYYFDRHRAFAAVVYPMIREGRHVDNVTFRAAAGKEDDDGKLSDFAAQVFATPPPPPGQVLTYLDLFADQAAKRAAKSLLVKAGETLEKGELSAAAAAAEVLRVASNLEASHRLAGTATTEGDDLEAFFAALEARQSVENDFQGLNTGFSHLNRIINGLTPGLIVLGAMPSTGKTTLAKQIADHVVATHGDAACLFVSLEQSKEELRIKTLSRLSGVENRDLQRGRMDTVTFDSAWKKVGAAKDEFAQWAGRFQVIEGDRTTTVDRIRLAALQLRQKTQAARLLIVVDYLQILPVDDDFGDIRQKVNFVTSELRRIGRDLDAPVLAIASVNRAAYTKTKGELDAFKESGDVEFSADVALMLVDDKDKKTGEGNYLGVMRKWRRVFLDVVKNRNGERSRVELYFYPEVSRFEERGKTGLPD